jgi:hypothetical protein
MGKYPTAQAPYNRQSSAVTPTCQRTRTLYRQAQQRVGLQQPEQQPDDAVT